MKTLLDLLETVAKRPGMYLGPLTYESAHAFLLGFQLGARLAGLDYSGEQYVAAARERGWDPSGNIGILRDFRRKGLSDEQMARELIAVALAAYRQAAAETKERPQPRRRKSKQ